MSAGVVIIILFTNEQILEPHLYIVKKHIKSDSLILRRLIWKRERGLTSQCYATKRHLNLSC